MKNPKNRHLQKTHDYTTKQNDYKISVDLIRFFSSLYTFQLHDNKKQHTIQHTQHIQLAIY